MKRRQFIKSMLASAGAWSVSPFAIGKPEKGSANERLNLGMIGVGGVAYWSYGWIESKNPVALCDVDDERAAKGYKRFPDLPRFKDYRVMLDKMGKSLDGVVISTPDHIHFPAAMAAMERGINVFVQKPATHDIWQSRTLLKAAQKHGVVTQMGNQGHATEGIRQVKEWYEAGVLGDVREVIAWTNRGSWAFRNPMFANPEGTETIPKTLDWDLWLGPVRHHHYSARYLPHSWRFFWDFGSGALGDIGCHTLDTPVWAMDLPMPTKIEPGFHTGGEKPDSLVTFHFPAHNGKPPVTIKWYEGMSEPPMEGLPEPKTKGDKDGGLIMIGSKKTLYHFNMRPYSPRLLMPDEEWREFRKTLPPKTLPRVKGGIMEDWAKGITEGTTPCSSFEVSTRLNELILLGVLAQRAGHPIGWDEEKMIVPGHPEFAEIIKQPVRDGWSYGEELWKA